MVRSMASTVLRSEGYEVLEANNGRDALDVLARAATLPTLVLLDLTMPVMGGADLVPILNHDYPGLRVIVTSGYSEEDARGDLPPGAVADFFISHIRLQNSWKKWRGPSIGSARMRRRLEEHALTRRDLPITQAWSAPSRTHSMQPL
jgi:CheY-like chemotaxis protein